jgi:hypothetical protein
MVSRIEQILETSTEWYLKDKKKVKKQKDIKADS